MICVQLGIALAGCPRLVVGNGISPALFAIIARLTVRPKSTGRISLEFAVSDSARKAETPSIIRRWLNKSGNSAILSARILTAAHLTNYFAAKIKFKLK